MEDGRHSSSILHLNNAQPHDPTALILGKEPVCSTHSTRQPHPTKPLCTLGTIKSRFLDCPAHSLETATTEPASYWRQFRIE